jgi:hypothetical protein
MTTNITTTTETTTVVVEENIVRIELNNIGVQGVPGANTDPTYVTVRNATGATLAKGTIVYISGANGNHVQVTPAIATSDATSARTLGWLSAAIANNASGLCMVEGYLEGINTQSLNAGDQLYLSGTVAGGFTATKPVAPIHLVYVGVVTKKSAGDGHVFVKVQNGYELGELHDVQIISPTNNQVLAYDSATSLWKNATNAPDGVTSITATAPLTGGTITSTGSIGLDQTALSITKSQVSDFTSGTVTSASTAQQAGTALFATNASTAVFATTSGTATFATNASTAVTISGSITKSQVSDFTSGTVAQADNATTSGTALFANTSGTAVFATTSGTATTISGDITRSQVSDFASGTVASAGTAQQSGTAVFSNTSGTATFATNASTAVSVSGSAITQSQVVNLVSDLANTAKLNTANTFTVGGHVVANNGVGITPLVLRGVASQTSNMFEIQDEGFATYASISKFGTTRLGGSIMTGGRLMVAAGGALVGLQVRDGGTGANIAEFQSSAGAILGVVTSTGTFRSAGLITAGSSTDVLGQLSVITTVASRVGQVIRGAASQSADLLQLQNSAGTNLVRADQFGGLFSTYANFTSDAAGTLPLRVRGASGQTADLQQWQNSGGTVLTEITSTGMLEIRPSSGDTINFRNSGGTLTLWGGASSYFTTVPIYMTGGSWTGGRLSIDTVSAGNVGATIRGAASQTANLTEWQNSAGTVQARVASDGTMFSASFTNNNGRLAIGENNAGGTVRFERSTAAQTNPGANYARLYFRDGTNAGTLKLVVRAGAAGAETTILDNIPQ